MKNDYTSRFSNSDLGRSVIPSNISNQVHVALRPLNNILNFTINKGIPAAVTMLSLPIHGINFCLFKKRNPGRKYDFKNSRITKASNKVSKALTSLPNHVMNRHM